METDRSHGHNLNRSRNSGLGKKPGTNRSRATEARKAARGAERRQPQRPLPPTDRS